MKFICTCIISFIASVLFAGSVPDFGNNFPKFQVKNLEINWVATNQLQEDLWTYKTIPQHFPSSAISNLVAIGKFTMQDEHNGHREISDTNDETLFFYSEERLCNLSVIPAQGRIEYWNELAPANHWDRTNHLWEQVEGLPNDQQVQELGLNLLNQFGIQRSDLAQRQDGHLITFGQKRTRGYFDRRTQKYIDDEVIARGVFFIRRIDGVDIAGIGLNGGCEIDYGNHTNISNFRLNWPKLQPYEHYKVASRGEIIQFAREGKAVMTHKNLVNPAAVKSITVTDVAPFYSGSSRDEPQDFVHPFAQLNAVANLGYTNLDIQLYCPILSTNSVNSPPH